MRIQGAAVIPERKLRISVSRAGGWSGKPDITKDLGGQSGEVAGIDASIVEWAVRGQSPGGHPIFQGPALFRLVDGVEQPGQVDHIGKRVLCSYLITGTLKPCAILAPGNTDPACGGPLGAEGVDDLGQRAALLF